MWDQLTTSNSGPTLGGRWMRVGSWIISNKMRSNWPLNILEQTNCHIQWIPFQTPGSSRRWCSWRDFGLFVLEICRNWINRKGGSRSLIRPNEHYLFRIESQTSSKDWTWCFLCPIHWAITIACITRTATRVFISRVNDGRKRCLTNGWRLEMGFIALNPQMRTNGDDSDHYITGNVMA